MRGQTKSRMYILNEVMHLDTERKILSLSVFPVLKD